MNQWVGLTFKVKVSSQIWNKPTQLLFPEHVCTLHVMQWWHRCFGASAAALMGEDVAESWGAMTGSGPPSGPARFRVPVPSCSSKSSVTNPTRPESLCDHTEGSGGSKEETGQDSGAQQNGGVRRGHLAEGVQAVWLRQLL